MMTVYHVCLLVIVVYQHVCLLMMVYIMYVYSWRLYIVYVYSWRLYILYVSESSTIVRPRDGGMAHHWFDIQLCSLDGPHSVLPLSKTLVRKPTFKVKSRTLVKKTKTCLQGWSGQAPECFFFLCSTYVNSVFELCFLHLCIACIDATTTCSACLHVFTSIRRRIRMDKGTTDTSWTIFWYSYFLSTLWSGVERLCSRLYSYRLMFEEKENCCWLNLRKRHRSASTLWHQPRQENSVYFIIHL